MGIEKKPFHEIVAAKLIKQLQEGTAPWQKPWTASVSGEVLPFNPITGKRYKGINALHLMSEGCEDPRWMTYKQATSLDAQVRKGESGTQIQYWKFAEEQTGIDSDGKAVKCQVQLERPRVFFATVFNATQIDGLPPIGPSIGRDWDCLERAENVLAGSGATIFHGEVDRAFYRPSTDSIHLPNRSRFPSADNYYAVALHELGHWTGHENRLHRDLSHPFGSEAYAREELRAEIASMLIGAELGVGHDPGQHVAYVDLWVKNLRNHPLEIFHATGDAEKILEYVMGLEQKHEQNLAIANTLNLTVAQVLRYEDTSRIDDMHLAIVEAEIHMVRRLGLHTLQDVIGNDPLMFSNTARSRLAPAFELTHQDPNVAFFAKSDHEALARRFVSKAEELVAGEKEELLRPSVAVAKSGDNLTESNSISVPGKVFVTVPYQDKEEAKALGAKWDRQEQSWYFSKNVDSAQFAKWLPKAGLAAEPAPRSKQSSAALSGRVYLAVPYKEREEAKKLGALWDKSARSWYAGPKSQIAKLEKWLPQNVTGQQDPMMIPREEFADALRSAGFLVGKDSSHPIMDGKKHRVSVIGEKFTEHAGSGSYVAYLDGHPSGFIKNYRTGFKGNWKAKGYSLSDEQKAVLAAEAAQKRQQRQEELFRRREEAASRVSAELKSLVPITEETPYMQRKRISVHAGAWTDGDGQITYLPAYDVEGKHWTTQYITGEGEKRFAKNGRKEGCFHVLGGMEKLADVPAIVIAEGYATAATLKESLGFATVAAFDAGNLPAVAEALHGKFPDIPIVIAADDDRHLELTQGINPGRAKAEEAAKRVAGMVLVPIFAPGENSYPEVLSPVTPESFRKHIGQGPKLSEEQLAALARMKVFTDFNDLANQSLLGSDGVNRQVKAFVGLAIEQQKAVVLADQPIHVLGKSAPVEGPDLPRIRTQSQRIGAKMR